MSRSRLDRAMIPRPDPMCEDWTVVGRGPSLVRARAEDVLGGSRVVAVNGAIYHHAIEAHYWCGLDAPDKWLDPDGPEPPWGPNRKPEVVTCKMPKWDVYAERLGLVVHQFPGGNGGHNEISLLLGDRKRNTLWAKWSILAAIAWARWGGARRIRLIGVDMEGDVRAYGRGNRIDARRWVKETKDFAVAMETCRAAGVEVERWTT